MADELQKQKSLDQILSIITALCVHHFSRLAPSHGPFHTENFCRAPTKMSLPQDTKTNQASGVQGTKHSGICKITHTNITQRYGNVPFNGVKTTIKKL